MTVNERLRAASREAHADLAAVTVPPPPSHAPRFNWKMVVPAAAVALVALLFFLVGTTNPEPAHILDRPAESSPEVEMVRSWAEGAVAGRFDEIAELTYGEVGEPESLAGMAEMLFQYTGAYGEPAVRVTPFNTGVSDMVFTCLAVDFGSFRIEGGMVIRTWPEQGTKVWEYRNGMAGCTDSEPSATTIRPSVPTEVVPIPSSHPASEIMAGAPADHEEFAALADQAGIKFVCGEGQGWDLCVVQADGILAMVSLGDSTGITALVSGSPSGSTVRVALDATMVGIVWTGAPTTVSLESDGELIGQMGGGSPNS